MTRGGRRITLIALVLIAVWLHITHCAWRFPTDGSRPDAPVLASGEWYRISTGSGSTAWTFIGKGLFAQSGLSGSEGSVWGVAMPFALLAACVVLMLAWRRHDRIASGACAMCGHALDLPERSRCPECGSRCPS
jgi:hypothetical protein